MGGKWRRMNTFEFPSAGASRSLTMDMAKTRSLSWLDSKYMYVCMYACMHVCMYACISISISINTYVFAYAAISRCNFFD